MPAQITVIRRPVPSPMHQPADEKRKRAVKKAAEIFRQMYAPAIKELETK